MNAYERLTLKAAVELVPRKKTLLDVTTDTMVAEGVVTYLDEIGVQLPVISFDSVKPKLHIDAYVDVHAIKLGRVAFSNLLQIINDNKEDKLWIKI